MYVEEVCESIESSFKSIDNTIVDLKDDLNQIQCVVESRLIECLSDSAGAHRLDTERSSLLYRLGRLADNDLVTLKPKSIRFCAPPTLSDTFDKFDLNLRKCLVYQRPFSTHKKLAYLHLLPRPVPYVDFDLFDIKFPHSSIRHSSLIGANRIFLFISLSLSSAAAAAAATANNSNNDYVMQVHQIDRSSLSTCRQVTKRSLYKYDFEFAAGRIVAAFNYRLVEVYDSNLNLLKQIDFVLTEGSFLSYKRMLSSRGELIFDFNDHYRIYNNCDQMSPFGGFERVGQTVDPAAPFYIDLADECELLATSRQFLFFSTPDRHFIQLMSRRTGQVTVSFSMTHILGSISSSSSPLDSNFYGAGVSFHVDFDSSLVYFKSNATTTSTIYCLDLNSNLVKNNIDTRSRLDCVQADFDSSGLHLRVVFDDDESGFGEPIVVLYKRNFSTQNLKLVYIF